MAQATTRLTPSIIRQVKAYQRALRDANIPVTQLIVFGSQAKGRARFPSDIDVAIVSPVFGIDYHSELVSLLGLRVDKAPDIEPHPLHPKDLEDRWSTFAQEIRRHGIKV